MFHFSSNQKAIETMLMQEEKLCRKNMVIYSRTKYINRICKHVVNIRTKRSLNQNNAIKLLDPLHSMNIHSQNITQSGQNNYTLNESTNNIYYCIKIMAQNKCYIPEFIINHLLNLCWEWEISLCKHMLLN